MRRGKQLCYGVAGAVVYVCPDHKGNHCSVDLIGAAGQQIACLPDAIGQ